MNDNVPRNSARDKVPRLPFEQQVPRVTAEALNKDKLKYNLEDAIASLKAALKR